MRDFLEAVHAYPVTSFLIGCFIFSLLAIFKDNGK